MKNVFRCIVVLFLSLICTSAYSQLKFNAIRLTWPYTPETNKETHPASGGRVLFLVYFSRNGGDFQVISRQKSNVTNYRLSDLQLVENDNACFRIQQTVPDTINPKTGLQFEDSELSDPTCADIVNDDAPDPAPIDTVSSMLSKPEKPVLKLNFKE